MTKTKSWLLIFAISVVLVAGSLAMSPIAIADDDGNGSSLDITEAEIESDDGEFEVEIETGGDIATDGSDGAFGYGVIGSSRILVATTHAGVGPDHPDQTDINDPVWHAHTVTLGENLGCPDDLAVASITSPSLPIEVDDNELEIEEILTSLAGSLTGPSASFTLSVIGDPANPTAVCVNDLQTFDVEIDD